MKATKIPKYQKNQLYSQGKQDYFSCFKQKLTSFLIQFFASQVIES